MVKKNQRRDFLDSVQGGIGDFRLGNKYSTRKGFTTPSDHLLSVTDNLCSLMYLEKFIEPHLK